MLRRNVFKALAAIVAAPLAIAKQRESDWESYRAKLKCEWTKREEAVMLFVPVDFEIVESEQTVF